MPLALYFFFYNFCRVHKTLGATPAMGSGLCDHVMKMTDCVALIDAANPVPAVRGSYKKRETVEITNRDTTTYPAILDFPCPTPHVVKVLESGQESRILVFQKH